MRSNLSTRHTSPSSFSSASCVKPGDFIYDLLRKAAIFKDSDQENTVEEVYNLIEKTVQVRPGNALKERARRRFNHRLCYV